MPVIDVNKLMENRVSAIREYHKQNNIQKAELDLSGGIDSGVMACLLDLALGKENIILVHSNINTNPKQTERATELAEALNIPLLNLDLNDIYLQLINTIRTEVLKKCPEGEIVGMIKRIESDKTVLGSIRSCLRAPIGRGCNRILGGGIRHGTGNECEDRYLRFYQKGGDGEVDTNPIEMLSKTEVYQLAYGLIEYYENHLDRNIRTPMRKLIAAMPSPDLWGNGDSHSDEDELKKMTGVDFSYGRVDASNGQIINYGTIEVISRLADRYCEFIDVYSNVELFPFYDAAAINELLNSGKCNDILNLLPKEKLLEYVNAAITAEKQSRHKQNSTIPTLGYRRDLIKEGILTDELKQV